MATGNSSNGAFSQDNIDFVFTPLTATSFILSLRSYCIYSSNTGFEKDAKNYVYICSYDIVFLTFFLCRLQRLL